MKNLILFFMTLLLLAQCQVAYARYCTIVESNCTEASFAFNATLRKNILTRAILKEALSLLPYNLSPLRREMLLFFLETHPLKFVLSYKEKEFSQKGAPMLEVDVAVNKQVLKKVLKAIGVYFERKSLFFSLSTKGLDEKDHMELFNLETLSNMVEDPQEKGLHMEVTKVGRAYSGSLSFGKKLWSDTTPSLSLLWQHLWGKYFSLPEIKRKYYTIIQVCAHGWLTVAGLKFFEKDLCRHIEILDEVEMESLDMKEDIGGRWKIYTLRPSALISFLTNYFLKREMEFQLTTLSSPSTNP